MNLILWFKGISISAILCYGISSIDSSSKNLLFIFFLSLSVYSEHISASERLSHYSSILNMRKLSFNILMQDLFASSSRQISNPCIILSSFIHHTLYLIEDRNFPVGLCGDLMKIVFVLEFAGNASDSYFFLIEHILVLDHKTKIYQQFS